MKTYTPEMIREEMQGEFTLVIAKYEDEEYSSIYLIPTIRDEYKNGRKIYRTYVGVNKEAGKKVADKICDFDSNLTTLDMIDYDIVEGRYLVEKKERKNALR